MLFLLGVPIGALLLWLKPPTFRARGLCVLRGNLIDVLTESPYGYRGVRRIHVVIEGIGVPNVGEPGFKESRQAAAELAMEQTLRVRVAREMAPDTVLGDILLEDGSWLSEALLLRGVARHKRKDTGS